TTADALTDTADVQELTGENRNAGAAVVTALRANGVDTIFGIPGTHNLELYRHLPAAGITAVTTRHEQGAGYAADGYYQVGGKPGVVITTSGPAVFNVAAAAGTAWAESRPLLIISPGLPRGTLGGDAGQLHETKDASGALDRIVAWSRRVESPDEAALAVTDAFAFFAAGRPRPVHIEVPVDVLEEPWSGNAVAAPVAIAAAPSPEVVRRAAELMAGARQPVLICGGGARGATQQIRVLAERLGAPVITTCNGKGVLPEDHPLSVGASIRLSAAHQFIAAADVALVVGSELGDSDLWGGTVDAAAVIRLDIDPGQMHKNRTAQLQLIADAEVGLSALIAALPAGVPAPGAAEAVGTLRTGCAAQSESEGAAWLAVNQAVRQALPAGSTLAGDSSQVTYFGSAHFFPVQQPGEFLYMAGFATLGYGLPAAIGAKIADPSRAVAVLLGDGALMFSVQEIVTAVEQRLPIPIVVLDNRGYAEIKDQQAQRGIAPIGVDLCVPDLPALARACGANGVDAGSAAEVAGLVTEALKADRPTLIRLAC
ncbi:MAG: thiamine pyrophosphate-dependent enzyme, partial [Nakamurella sp.]